MPLDLLLQDFFTKNPDQMNNAVLTDRVSAVKGRREDTMAVPGFEGELAPPHRQTQYDRRRGDGFLGNSAGGTHALRRSPQKLKQGFQDSAGDVRHFHYRARCIKGR